MLECLPLVLNIMSCRILANSPNTPEGGQNTFLLNRTVAAKIYAFVSHAVRYGEVSGNHSHLNEMDGPLPESSENKLVVLLKLAPYKYATCFDGSDPTNLPLLWKRYPAIRNHLVKTGP